LIDDPDFLPGHFFFGEIEEHLTRMGLRDLGNKKPSR
jgi:hypothetical protein